MKYEYQVSDLNDLPLEGIQGEIARCAALGWRLIAVDRGYHYFERLVESKHIDKIYRYNPNEGWMIQAE